MSLTKLGPFCRSTKYSYILVYINLYAITYAVLFCLELRSTLYIRWSRVKFKDVFVGIVCSAPNTPPHNKEQVSSFVRLHARCKTTPGVRRMWPIHIITHLDPFPSHVQISIKACWPLLYIKCYTRRKPFP